MSGPVVYGIEANVMPAGIDVEHPETWARLGRLDGAEIIMSGPPGGPWSSVLRINDRAMRMTLATDPDVEICGAVDGPVICRCLQGHDGPHIAFEDTPEAATVGLHLARLESIR